MSTVMVLGGGKVGSHLARLLVEGGHSVTIVEANQRVCDLLDGFEGATVVYGSGTEAAVLENAGIRTCDVVAAVTGADEVNLVACTLARFEFGVPRTIARIVDPTNAWMYQEDMGVDVALNQADLLAHLVAEEMSLGEMTTLLKLRRGQYALVEQKVDPDSDVVGANYGEVTWPAGCRIVAVIQRGELARVTPDFVFSPADEVLAVVHSEAAAALAQLLGPAEEETDREG